MAKKKPANDNKRTRNSDNGGYKAKPSQMNGALRGNIISDAFETNHGLSPSGGLTFTIGGDHSIRCSEPLHRSS